MIICESEFDLPDKNNPNYSMTEVDYYSYIPTDRMGRGFPNHRLTLRKNLKTGEYELYRRYYDRQVAMTRANGEQIEQLVLERTVNNPIEIIYRGTIEGAFKRAYDEQLKFWAGVTKNIKPDILCTHKGKLRAMGCEIK